MLQALRDKTSGWIATVILALLMIPFAFFGMEQYLFQRIETYAAKVEIAPAWWKSAPDWAVVRRFFWHKEEIGADEFRTAFERARQQQRNALGENFDAKAFESADNKRKVLEDLIDQRVMKLASQRSGIVASDNMVKETIQAIPDFQTNGRFDPKAYQLALASQIPPVSPLQFQQQVREGLQQGLVQTQLAQSSFATSGEVDRLLRMLGETRAVSYTTIPRGAPDMSPVSDAEVQAWFKANASKYRAPETVTFEYIDLDAATMPVPALTDAELQALYEREKASLAPAEQRAVSHILVAVPAGADAAAQKAAQDKANAIAVEARAPGADFAAIARARSDDSGSKGSGGDLGWIGKGVMPKPFEDAVFALSAPGVVGPVKTDAGYHVIRLREIRAGQTVPFEQAREQLVRENAERERERNFNAVIGKVVDEMLKNPSSLADAARVAGVAVHPAQTVARGQGAGVAGMPAVQRVAFSDSMIQDQTVSDPIEVAQEHSVFIRVTGHTPEQALPLDRVRERVIAEIRGDRSRKAAEAEADAMLAKVRAGQSLEALATAGSLVTTNVAAMTRDAPMLSPEAGEAVFATPAPASGKVSAGKVAVPEGVLVFAVSAMTPGNPQIMPAQQRAQLEQQLAQADGADDANALVEAWRKRVKITVAEDRL